MAGEDLNPRVYVTISGNPLGGNALEFVSSVTVERSLDKADLITLTIMNPFKDAPGQARTSELLWTNSMAWMPGNTIEVWFAYADAPPDVVYAGIIKKWMPHFPATGMPKLQIKAFDGSSLMMDGPIATDPRTFEEGTTISDMVLSVLADYGFNTDAVEEVTTAPAVTTIKKAGMSDYAFVRGLANIVGFEFYVSWDAEGKVWRAVFRKPLVNDMVKKRFVWGPDFEGTGGDGILLDFYPEFVTHAAATDVEVYYFDEDTRAWEKIIYPEEEPDRENNKPEFEWKGDDEVADDHIRLAEDYTSARGLRIKAGGVAVEVVPSHGIRSAETAYNFARAWWETRQSLLIQGKGRIIGWPVLDAGQVHELGGIGKALEGDWYFAEVKHRYARGSTYTTEFVARKVIP